MQRPTRYGDEVVTLDRVAREAGVSPSTVSRILNGTARVSEAKRDAVEQAIRRLNYQPNAVARGLASGRTLSIGVLAPDIASPLYADALRAIEQSLADQGYWPLFVSRQGDDRHEYAQLCQLASRQVDGVILLAGQVEDERLRDYALRTPICLIGRQLQAPNVQSVVADISAGASMAVQHLLDLGHRRIAYIGPAGDSPEAQACLHGYQQTLRQAGLEFDRRLVLGAEGQGAGGMLAMQRLLDSRLDFSAVFAGDDQLALGAQLALRRRNLRIPDEMSLVGFGDLPVAPYTTPPLTTVRLPGHELGSLAAKAIVRLIDGETPRLEVPPLQLVIRESTRRLRR
ncbi:LacI family DNA-binding transcriptional regulator [Parachitinimonas caeni]|uniref:LacI family DNA-binding transcriptional regulator n=1 Tax=Parachitinimonas caeni TaxID=3031301 RepID=A0ABT7DU37_9NEIS|nr:LacI family DNA-binding transcriptional regulator [Parachitinimonas caeni]MDK2123588.1 LacI family DNA-binding transcriptional regulator [Parachitinimonas caeni]